MAFRDNTFEYILNGVILTYMGIKSYLTDRNQLILVVFDPR
jgi:hypothetical protein